MSDNDASSDVDALDQTYSVSVFDASCDADALDTTCSVSDNDASSDVDALDQTYSVSVFDASCDADALDTTCSVSDNDASSDVGALDQTCSVSDFDASCKNRLTSQIMAPVAKHKNMSNRSNASLKKQPQVLTPAGCQMVQRFMNKWSSTRKSIITHEADSSAEVMNKVLRNTKNKHPFTTTFRPNFGNIFRTQN